MGTGRTPSPTRWSHRLLRAVVCEPWPLEMIVSRTTSETARRSFPPAGPGHVTVKRGPGASPWRNRATTCRRLPAAYSVGSASCSPGPMASSAMACRSVRLGLRYHPRPQAPCSPQGQPQSVARLATPRFIQFTPDQSRKASSIRHAWSCPHSRQSTRICRRAETTGHPKRSKPVSAARPVAGHLMIREQRLRIGATSSTECAARWLCTTLIAIPAPGLLRGQSKERAARSHPTEFAVELPLASLIEGDRPAPG